MKDEKKGLSKSPSKKRMKSSPPIPAVLLLEPKGKKHLSPKSAADPQWISHIPIRKEP